MSVAGVFYALAAFAAVRELAATSSRLRFGRCDGDCAAACACSRRAGRFALRVFISCCDRKPSNIRLIGLNCQAAGAVTRGGRQTRRRSG